LRFHSFICSSRLGAGLPCPNKACINHDIRKGDFTQHTEFYTFRTQSYTLSFGLTGTFSSGKCSGDFDLLSEQDSLKLRDAQLEQSGVKYPE